MSKEADPEIVRFFRDFQMSRKEAEHFAKLFGGMGFEAESGTSKNLAKKKKKVARMLAPVKESVQ